MSTIHRSRKPRRDLGRRDRHLTAYGHAPQRSGTSAKALRPLAVAALEPGLVVWARVAYADDPNQSKSRPVVVVAVDGDDVTVAPVTSSQRRAQFGAVELHDWAAAGLNRPCGLTARPVVVDRRLDVYDRIGRLTDADLPVLDRYQPVAA